MTQAQIIAQVLAAMQASAGKKKAAKRGAKAKKAPLVKSPEATAERKATFAAAVIEACKEKGLDNIVPNETVLTYGKWAEKGFVVKKGEKSIRVKTKGMRGKGIPLFHISQVEAETAAA